eukprot:CAMPEP_0185417018 /NCGR_PEP_ID=MMETSP1365-20130426/7689_1 /TAXON_ID=38817 /ORGANISM="Gephyrocapsa oceanica, Strain RCC1303" /LENGTH=60 /DNA_ID=CAMNT_0028020297 /DNA_START=122 /DNA_END=301 /DNA_ORIENTATION=+
MSIHSLPETPHHPRGCADQPSGPRWRRALAEGYGPEVRGAHVRASGEKQKGRQGRIREGV